MVDCKKAEVYSVEDLEEQLQDFEEETAAKHEGKDDCDTCVSLVYLKLRHVDVLVRYNPPPAAEAPSS